MEQALSLSRARFSNHGIHIEVIGRAETIPFPTVYGKSSSLFQVMVNLLNNAFDALETEVTGGRVRIEYRDQEGDTFSIRVSDNGIGIPGDFAPRLFEPFQTTKPEGRGTGLGLTISRRLMRSQGGDLLRAEAEEGFSTAFEILLKKNPTPENFRSGVDSKEMTSSRY